VEIKLVRRENRQLVTELRVLIEPHMQVVDHVLRYYERDNRQSKIQLPPLYTFTQPPDKRPLVYVTDQNVVIEWGRDNNEIKLSFKVGEVCSVRRFNVLAYADPYNSELVGNWSIEVHSLAGYHNIISRSLDLEVPMGQQVVSRLTLPADVTRVVKLFCSHSSIITFPEQYKNEFTLVPGKLNIIEYFARSISETGIRAQINCVDVNSQDLIYAWILKVSAVPQPPSAVYEIKCQEGRDSKNSMSYLNSTNYLTTFRFDSSHPSYVMVHQLSHRLDR
jgi:nephrocystin-4